MNSTLSSFFSTPPDTNLEAWPAANAASCGSGGRRQCSLDVWCTAGRWQSKGEQLAAAAAAAPPAAGLVASPHLVWRVHQEISVLARHLRLFRHPGSARACVRSFPYPCERERRALCPDLYTRMMYDSQQPEQPSRNAGLSRGSPPRCRRRAHMPHAPLCFPRHVCCSSGFG